MKRRIANNHKYEILTDEKLKSVNNIERDFYVCTKTVITLFYKRSKYPKRLNANKPFTITNDYHIAELSDCIKFIGEQGITSATDLQSKIEEINSRTEQAENRIAEINDMQKTIFDLKEKSKFYWKTTASGGANSALETKLATTKKLLDEYSIESQDDIDTLVQKQENNESEKSELQKQIETNRAEISKFAKLIEIHEQVVDGSYINRLVQLEIARQAAEEKAEQHNLK
ncbi:hypothetical protein FACS1894188_12810 [Clostridia bacterium]|nr:hypothetical protein FACS1894188_12810 [Clostridia bacterium]